jgi:hypothetical protein
VLIVGVLIVGVRRSEQRDRVPSAFFASWRDLLRPRGGEPGGWFCGLCLCGLCQGESGSGASLGASVACLTGRFVLGLRPEDRLPAAGRCSEA